MFTILVETDASTSPGITGKQALILAGFGIAATLLAAVIPAVVNGRAERRARRAERLRGDLVNLRDYVQKVTLAGKLVQESPGSRKPQIELREALVAVQSNEGLIFSQDIRDRSKVWREYAERFYAGATGWTSKQEAILLGQLMDAIGSGYRELRVGWFVTWHRPWAHRMG